MNKLNNLNILMNKNKFYLKTNGYKSNKLTIFVSNHICIRDAFYISYILNNKVVFTSSSNSVYKNKYKEKIMNKCLYLLPLELYGNRKYKDIYLDKLLDLLKENINIIFFPEGVYTTDGKINRGHTGVSRLIIKALDNNIDFNIVPIYINIEKNDKDKASVNFNNEIVNITFLKEIDTSKILEEYQSSNNKNQVLHNIVDNIMLRIADYGKIVYKDKYKNYVTKKRIYIIGGSYVNKNILLSKKYYNKYINDLEKRKNYIIKHYKENI